MIDFRSAFKVESKPRKRTKAHLDIKINPQEE